MDALNSIWEISDNMSLCDELQEGVGSLWARVVTHPFIIELGDGTLPQEIFDVYFEQDYLFVKELAILLVSLRPKRRTSTMRLATWDWVVREDYSSKPFGSGGCHPRM